MKKIAALFLALMMLFTLAACGDGNKDSDDPSGGSETQGETGEVEFRLPENVRYRFKSNDDYQDLTVTKIGDELCIDNAGQIRFYRKNAEGTFDYWLQQGEGWMPIWISSSFDETMLGMQLGISTFGFNYDDVEKIGTDTVCGLSAEVYKSKYLQNNETYLHSGSDGVFIVKTVVGTTTIEIIEWSTENVEFTVEKPE